MASIQKRPNGKWRARYRDTAGKEHARHFVRKVDGQRWLDEQTAGMVTGQWVDPRRAKTPVRDYVAHWESIQVVREQTRRNIASVLHNHVLPQLGDRPIGSVLPSDVQALIKGMEDTHARGTIEGVLKILRRVFASAVRDRYIPFTPCVDIKLPDRRNDDRDDELVIPTLEQVSALAGAVPDRYRAVVLLLAGSGLRISEALGLRVSDVDFLRRAVTARRQRLRTGGTGPVKTEASKRTVPLGKVTVEALAAHLRAFPSDEWLFTDPLGREVTYSRWAAVWAPARESLGLDLDTHSLRHFYASALIQGGASVKVVQARLGHGSASVTLNTYTHLWPDDDEVTRSVMDQVLAPLADSVRTGTD